MTRRGIERPDSSELVNVAEAGRVLGVSVSTVWRMIRRRTIPSVLRGGRRLVPRGALEHRATRLDSGDVPPLELDHPIFRLVGAGRGGGREPGARDKHAILDER